MKYFILLFLAYFTLCIPLDSFSQSPDPYGWCPPGATWVYQRVHMGPGASFAMHRYVKDTIIQDLNIVAKKIEVEYFGTNSTQIDPNTFTHINMGYDLMYETGDTVYWWQDSSWTALYYFGAQLGDTLEFSNKEMECIDEDSISYGYMDKMWVVEEKQDTIGNLIYEAYRLDYNSMNDVLSFNGYFRKNIGNLQSFYPYLSNNPVCIGNIDRGGYDGLVCYRDDLRNAVNPNLGGWSNDFCHTVVTGLDDYLQALSSKYPIQVYPNPATHSLRIDRDVLMKDYRIYNLLGQIQVEARLEAGNRIDISRLAAGEYIISLFDREGNIYRAQFEKE